MMNTRTNSIYGMVNVFSGTVCINGFAIAVPLPLNVFDGLTMDFNNLSMVVRMTMVNNGLDGHIFCCQ